MLEHDRTLRYLEGVVRARPVERRLCCPECQGQARLRRDLDPELVLSEGDALYRCTECLSEFRSLGELKGVP